jgi:CxxC motif-containing protein
MSIEQEITCIVCPIGCKILVKTFRGGVEVLSGYKCKQGIDYVKDEALDPRRMITTSVLVENGTWPLVSVKSSKPVPKEKVFSILHQIRKKKVQAPVEIGQVIIKNVARTGISIIATKNIDVKRLGLYLKNKISGE